MEPSGMRDHASDDELTARSAMDSRFFSGALFSSIFRGESRQGRDPLFRAAQPRRGPTMWIIDRDGSCRIRGEMKSSGRRNQSSSRKNEEPVRGYRKPTDPKSADNTLAGNILTYHERRRISKIKSAPNQWISCGQSVFVHTKGTL